MPLIQVDAQGCLTNNGNSKAPNSMKKESNLVNSIYKYYPGKVEYKKRKAPTSPQKSVVSAKAFRVGLMEKTCNRRKKKSDVWSCVYCDISYDEDISNGRNKKWIACDNCEIKQHISCVPRSHLAVQNFDQEEEENDFKCEKCFDD